MSEHKKRSNFLEEEDLAHPVIVPNDENFQDVSWARYEPPRPVLESLTRPQANPNPHRRKEMTNVVSTLVSLSSLFSSLSLPMEAAMPSKYQGNHLILGTTRDGKPIIWTEEMRRLHLLITGRTRSGKSRLLQSLVRQDIARGQCSNLSPELRPIPIHIGEKK